MTAAQASELNRVIREARLVQVREGVPRPLYTGHTRERLIVRSKEWQIGGGMCNSSIAEPGTSDREIQAEIEAGRKESSSIGGDYDAVIKAMRALFPELKGLMAKAEGRR